MQNSDKENVTMAREFNVPGRIYTGAGALDMASAAFGGMGRKALVVTDDMMVKLGNCARLEQSLQSRGLACDVFSGVNGEPTDDMVEAGLALYQKTGCDFLVALGGGSPIDAMKAIATLAVGKGHIADYMGKTIDMPIAPMAAIPTTAGTGSEATQFTIITDTRQNVKMLLKGKVLIPDLAIIDPQFTMTAPPKITANTGLDALCHATEAYTSRHAQALSDTFALSAVKRIFRHLPIVFRDGDHLEARVEMSIAALEAGIAFNNASVTIIHGMSRPIGALFHVPHGLSNAMLMKECLAYVLPGAYERFAALGRAIGAAGDADSDQTAGKKFVAALSELLKKLEIPTLREAGVPEDAFMAAIDKMAHDALASGSPQNTLREITEADVKEIYRRLW
jgi:alcohol dehydrogenase class IV